MIYIEVQCMVCGMEYHVYHDEDDEGCPFCAESLPMKFSKTNRGFALIEFTDRYGKACSLQKSSLATEDCVWLGVDHGAIDLPPGVHCLSRMHLTRRMAESLIKHLTTFVETGELTPSV